MAVLKTDGTFTTATICGAERFSTPIPGDSTTTQFEQDYMVAITSYSPLTIGTAHGTHTDHYLIQESAVSDLGGGIGLFTRTYCKVPAARDEYESFAYNFIGFWQPPSIFGAGAIGRDRFSRTVQCRIAHAYALATPPSMIYAQQYFMSGQPTYKTDYLFFAANVNDSADAAGALTVETYQSRVSALTELVAEDSTISRWAGNIYERRTRYVVAL